MRILLLIILLSGILSSFVRAEVKFVFRLDESFNENETVVWSPIMQASWDKLNSSFPEKPVSTFPINKNIEYLDDFQWNEDKVMPKMVKIPITGMPFDGFSEEGKANDPMFPIEKLDGFEEGAEMKKFHHSGYKVYAGRYTKEFYEETIKDVRLTFDEDVTRFFPEQEEVNGIAFLGVLKRSLNFDDRFPIFDTRGLKFHSMNAVKEVKCFGAKMTNNRSFRCVRVVKYSESKHEYIISIATKMKGEEVVMFQPEKRMTILEAINLVKAAKRNPFKGSLGARDDPRLHKKDEVMIPFVKFMEEMDVSNQLRGVTTFRDLENTREIQSAKLMLNFDMNEEGVAATAVFGGWARFSARKDEPEYHPRKFIFDRPFFVFMWKEGADYPYFATYIGNTDGMLNYLDKE